MKLGFVRPAAHVEVVSRRQKERETKARLGAEIEKAQAPLVFDGESLRRASRSLEPRSRAGPTEIGERRVAVDVGRMHENLEPRARVAHVAVGRVEERRSLAVFD